MRRQSTPEEWRAVVGFEDSYEVSNVGRVRMSRHRYRGARGGAQAPRILRAPPDRYGYPKVTLFWNGRKYSRTVHRLVAVAFLGEPPAQHQVHHRDNDRANACADNLEWVTAEVNIRQSFVTSPRHGPRRRRLNPDQEYAIRVLRRVVRGCELARIFGVSPAQVSRIQHS
jgi:hypothetical protein